MGRLARGDGIMAMLAGVAAAGLLGGCARPAPPTVARAPDARLLDQGVELTCEIGADDVRCSARNHGNSGKLICFEPHLAVRRTADSHGYRECTPWLPPGATADLVLDRFGVRPAEQCSPSGRGCVLRLFRDDEGLSAQIAFIRALEDDAPEAGRLHPTTKECEALRLAWQGRGYLGRFEEVLDDPDLSAAFCLRLPRKTFDCLAAAQTHANVERCESTIPAPRAGTP